MHTIKTIMLKISAAAILLSSTIASSTATEVSTSNFSGTINTTVTSGFTVRVDEDCSNLDGYIYESALGTYEDGSGAGCAVALGDAYGNTTTKALSRSSGSNDDGSMNFREGSIVSAKQKFFTEIIGSTANGALGINLSFTGFADPALDITSPTYAPLTQKAENDFKSGLDILNAYVNFSTETANNNYVDWTIGRQVTNWGEATFIPVGMNGLTTNALDLTKLRGPGSTIREALVPTAQVTASTSLGNNMNLEVFYQLEHRAVKLDPAGSFYGSEIVGTGSEKMITIGNYNKENKKFGDCNMTQASTFPLNANVLDTTSCNESSITQFRTDEGVRHHSISYNLTKGLMGSSLEEIAAAQLFAAQKTFGHANAGDLSTFAAAGWTDTYTATLNGILGSATDGGALVSGNAKAVGGVDKTFFATNTVGYDLNTAAGVTVNSYANDATGNQTLNALDRLSQATTETDLINDQLSTYAAVSIRRTSDFIKEARDDGQFGVKISGYSDAGTGLDWALNYSRFHSKSPYLRVVGQGGMYAGDIYGLIAKAGDTAVGSRTVAQEQLVRSITNSAYSAGVCNAVLAGPLATATYTGYNPSLSNATAAQLASENYDGSFGNFRGATTAQKAASDQFNFQKVINGQQIHNSASCFNTASGFNLKSAAALAAGDSDVNESVHAALYDTAEILVSAITPLNMAQYQLFYPEDLNAIGFSFNTTVDGTAVQGEITVRPNFPLSHSAGDQINQVGDVTGAFDLLDMFAFDAISKGVNNNTNVDGTDLNTIDGGSQVSPSFYRADTTGMTAAEIFQQGVRMSMVGLATPAGGGLWNVSGDVLGFDPTHLATYKSWMSSKGSTAALSLAGLKKAIFDTAYVASCNTVDALAVCQSHTLGAGSYNTAYYAAIPAVAGAYEYGTVGFNRSSLPALSKVNTVQNYYSTPFVEKDVWSFDLGTTTTFSASHPIVTSIGADSAALLTEVAVVAIAEMDNIADGYIARNGYQEGIGQDKCHGPFGAAVAGGTSFGGAAGALTHLGAGQVDALFGNGGYCEDQNGADEVSMSYRVIGTASYNNVNNSGWSLSPTAVWAHDPYGYGPSSLGGFVEDKMTMSLGLNARKGAAITMGVNYTAHLAGPEVDASSDKDTVTVSMSYSF